jgi:hypothetical protein
MSAGPEDRVRRSTHASWQELDGETVLLVPAEEKLLGLNAAAGRVWQLADGTRTVGAIAETIGREFGVEPADVESDVARFVDRLLTRGLLERCDL